MCDELVRCVCDGRGDRYCVGLSAVFFIHFLLKKRKVFFSLFFVSCISSLVCSFVCVFVVRGGVICVACIIILYSRTDAIHFKRFY